MRIGIVASVGRHFDAFWLEIISALRDRGHEVYLAAGSDAQNERVDVLRGVTRRPGPRSLSGAVQLRRWAQTRDLDLVVTNTAVCSALIRLAGLSVPVVYFAHGFHWASSEDRRTLHWQVIERGLIPFTSGFVVLNEDDHRWLGRFAPATPTLWLKYGIGLPLAKYPPVEVRSSNRVVWVGELSARKRPLLALRVFRELAAADPELQMDMLGKGALHADAERFVVSSGLAGRVHLRGHVDPTGFYRRAAMLLHTATWEGLPRVVLEALAVGVPVVGPPIKGLRGVQGVTVARDDSVSNLVAASTAVLAEPGRFAPAVDRDHLDVNAVAGSLSEFFESFDTTRIS